MWFYPIKLLGGETSQYEIADFSSFQGANYMQRHTLHIEEDIQDTDWANGTQMKFDHFGIVLILK